MMHRHTEKARALLARAGYADGGSVKHKPRYVATDDEPEGMVERGNIDINDTPGMNGRPGIRVDPEDPRGGVSSVLSTSFEDDHGHEVLVPSVKSGKGFIEDPEAEYHKTGQHLGKFKAKPRSMLSSDKLADRYAEDLHLQQEGAIGKKRGGQVRRLGRRHWRKVRGS